MLLSSSSSSSSRPAAAALLLLLLHLLAPPAASMHPHVPAAATEAALRSFSRDVVSEVSEVSEVFDFEKSGSRYEVFGVRL